MVINFELIIVYTGEIEGDGNYIPDILTTIADSQIYSVIEINPVETDIVEKLLFMCDKNDNSDVILIIGNIKSNEKHFVIEAVNNVTNSTKLSENVATLILNIETKLNDIMSHNTTCGVRNQTLIIDMSGPHKNLKECLEAVEDIILQLIHLIQKEDKDEEDKENIPLHNVASTSDNNSMKEQKVKIALKRRKKSTSPIALSFENKRHKKQTPFPMISMTDALSKMREIIKRNIKEVTFETVQLSNAYGRILCETVEATYDLPPFKSASKCGYAVLATDGKGIRKVLNENTSSSILPGTCMWVENGAPVPDGATSIVQIEYTMLTNWCKDSKDVYIKVMIEPKDEENIKPVGYDLMKGKVIGTPYTRIGPMEIALLAASGRKEVLVAKYISIGIMSIGSNLEKLEEPLKPGFIYDGNRITLISFLKEKGFHSLDFGIVDNKMASIRNKIDEALKEVDLLVTTGSTNDRDLLKIVLKKYYNADIHFGNVNIKPGKSTIFATCTIDNREKYFLCLPGNPASAFIGAQIFLWPLVNELCCNFQSEQTTLQVRLEHQYTLHSRSRVAWTILEWKKDEKCTLAFSKGNTINDKLISAVGANALLFLPEKETTKMLPDSFATALLVKLPKRINEKNFCDAYITKVTNKTEKKKLFNESLYD